MSSTKLPTSHTVRNTVPLVAPAESQKPTHPVSTSDNGSRGERRTSRDSSENDLVYLSEVSSINNGNESSHPASGETTPISDEHQQVDLKFERPDFQVHSPTVVVSKPMLAPTQRRDVKEPGYDEIEEAIQLETTSMLTNNSEFNQKHKSVVIKTQSIIGVGLSAILICSFIYLKYR